MFRNKTLTTNVHIGYFIAGPLQSWETAMQVFPSIATSERPAADQRPQSFGAEECPHASDGHRSVHAHNVQPTSHRGE